LVNNQSVVGANSVVTEDVSSFFSVVAGSTARIIKRYDFDLTQWVQAVKINDIRDNKNIRR
jgi:serine acetyltransferase